MRIKEERKMEKRKSAFRRLGLVGPRSIVCIFNEGYKLKEVGILPTLVYFHHKGLFVKYGNAALVLILCTSRILALALG